MLLDRLVPLQRLSQSETFKPYHCWHHFKASRVCSDRPRLLAARALGLGRLLCGDPAEHGDDAREAVVPTCRWGFLAPLSVGVGEGEGREGEEGGGKEDGEGQGERASAPRSHVGGPGRGFASPCCVLLWSSKLTRFRPRSGAAREGMMTMNNSVLWWAAWAARGAATTPTRPLW